MPGFDGKVAISPLGREGGPLGHQARGGRACRGRDRESGRNGQRLWWAAGYNIVAIPLAAGVLAPSGILLTPAMGAVLMSLSTIIVALNAQLLWRARL